MGRIHIVLHDALLARVDQRVGDRERSEFVAQAVREQLDRLDLEDAARRAAGAAGTRGHAHWRDRSAAAGWVRAIRRETAPRWPSTSSTPRR